MNFLRTIPVDSDDVPARFHSHVFDATNSLAERSTTTDKDTDTAMQI